MSLATVTAILQFTTVAVKAGAEKRVQEVAEVVILLIRLYHAKRKYDKESLRRSARIVAQAHPKRSLRLSSITSRKSG